MGTAESRASVVRLCDSEPRFVSQTKSFQGQAGHPVTLEVFATGTPTPALQVRVCTLWACGCSLLQLPSVLLPHPVHVVPCLCLCVSAVPVATERRRPAWTDQSRVRLCELGRARNRHVHMHSNQPRRHKGIRTHPVGHEGTGVCLCAPALVLSLHPQPSSRSPVGI